MVVMKWALTSKRTLQEVGDVLHTRDTGHAEAIVPRFGELKKSKNSTLWGTGRSLVAKALAPSKATTQVMHGHVPRLRRLMRFRNGMTTRWGQAGLVVQCAGVVQDALLTAQRERKKVLGGCRQWAVENTPWADLYPCDGQGVRKIWSTYAKVLGTMTNMPLRSVLRIEQEAVISVDPEQEGLLTIQTETNTQSVLWSPEKGNLQQEVAKALEVAPRALTITPHPWIQRVQTVWVGGRRWRYTRKRYKALISKANEALVRRTKAKIDEGWKASNAAIAEALEQLSWTRAHTMEGVTAYMTQNIVKLKLGRLRIWAGKELGFSVGASAKVLDSGHRNEG
ncbi:hypothetical protein PF004_g2833 [Phytophthora fragariae]|uniref:Uncharacterized protein n=1 Tax=Phytophthora fragariae TaxID=53985 RepID=A0A6G0PNS2_9STRA|nr:hypothetical protein PF004_g2833 [Phytophthora fragariae]